jgi:RNA-splicing ligase RtcB
MRIAQRYADLNRQAMIDMIVEGMGLHVAEQWTTVHNYIDMESRMLRKGAVSAREGEKILIPVNMRDGSLICMGKGNEDWNCSAPHGAGRLMSRTKARAELSLEQFRQSMDGIYTTSANLDTLDESPFAYKPIEDILQHVQDTVEIVETIRPVYNFKAAG